MLPKVPFGRPFQRQSTAGMTGQRAKSMRCAGRVGIEG
jgi:hypothetical protein